jgi:hypothetical protein
VNLRTASCCALRASPRTILTCEIPSASSTNEVCDTAACCQPNPSQGKTMRGRSL